MIALDIETVRIEVTEEDRLTFESEYSPPGNYKDPEKIEAHKQEAWKKFLDKVSWQTHRLITWAVASYDGVESGTAEEMIRLISVFDDPFSEPLVTFNGLNFDLPILAKELPEQLVAPYRRGQLIDLWNYPLQKSCGLKEACRAFGVKLEVEDIDGSMVAELYKAGEIEKIKKYNESDAKATLELAKKLSNFYALE